MYTSALTGLSWLLASFSRAFAVASLTHPSSICTIVRAECCHRDRAGQGKEGQGRAREGRTGRIRQDRFRQRRIRQKEYEADRASSANMV